MSGKHQHPLYAFAGDTFFTRSDTLLGRLIRWAETDPGEEKTWTNHTGVVVSGGWLVPRDEKSGEALAVVVESLSRTLHQVWWEAHRKEVRKGQRIVAFGPKTERNSQAIQAFRQMAQSFVGDRYGWWKLLFHGFDRAFFGGKKQVSKLLRVMDRPICSYSAAWSNWAQDMSFGMEPQAATPDEMHDYVLAHPKEWVQR